MLISNLARRTLLFLGLSLTFSVSSSANADRSSVNFTKDWAMGGGDRSLAELRNVTAIDFCVAQNEIRCELGDSMALRALTYDQDVVLGRKGFRGYQCPRNIREMAFWERTSSNTDGVLNDLSEASVLESENCKREYSPRVVVNTGYRAGEPMPVDRLVAQVESSFTKEVFNIDGLVIEMYTSPGDAYMRCDSGRRLFMRLTGVIGPDSSFAVAELLRRNSPCKDQSGRQIEFRSLSLNSGGGFLRDGYSLGNTLREARVATIVEGGATCASSCAVAYLGGEFRVVSDNGVVMFHAPYFEGKNEYGRRDVDCEIGDEPLKELRDFYKTMTTVEIGDRLFERTMWYCSASDGWMIKGGAAAELYGIATQR